jgi:purine-binding chemotaxis protein CheW
VTYETKEKDIVSTAEREQTDVAAAGEGLGTMQLVSFCLGGEEYGVEITKVREIILVGEITQLPQVPDFVEGVINLRSTVIPIVDLRKRFGMPHADVTEESRIVVVNMQGKTVGVVVDGVSEVLRISQNQITPPPPTVAGLGREYLIGLVQLDERLLVIVDIDRILGSENVHALEAAIAAA